MIPEAGSQPAGRTSRSKAVRELYDPVIRVFGKVDLLLHFVGGWVGGNALNEVIRGDISDMLDQHVRFTFHLIKTFIPVMVKNGWGRFLVIYCLVVADPHGVSFPYTLGKSGQEALVLKLAEIINRVE